MNVRCVTCRKEFDQAKVEHMPSTPINERWTCSLVCQKRIELMGQERQAAQLEMRKLAAEEDSAVPQANEAAKARVALKGLGALSPAERDQQHVTQTGDSSVEERLRAVAVLTTLASEMSGPEDRYVLAGLAHGLLDRAVRELETHTEAGAGPQEAAS